MKEYFQLQFKLLNRKIIDFGVPLILAYTLLPVLFTLVLNYLYSKTEFAIPILILSSISFIYKLSEPNRNDFLKTIFNNKNYKKIRIVENLIFSLPFSLFLLYKFELLYFLLLNVLAVCFSFLNFKASNNLIIPTPFNKKPFEFIIGFRKTFYIFPVAYILTYISISETNFNLGVFCMLLIGLVCLFYYSNLENEYFIWNFNQSPKHFLKEKVKTCAINFTILSSPILLTLSIYFHTQIDILALFFLLCITYQATVIFAKYTAFPNEISMSEGILIALSFMFPPILIIITPLFYLKSLKKLKTILL
ncbi:ABC transporter permease [Cellulophaga baltica]|uniref:ABC transporter permease n=1 Tax=Cellulophaga TaxID=104264 RepID=UPI001C06FF95|nr:MULTISPECIES: ABC transporter permease [Cellulophaga]MBU2997912.1 ABC transporter permease [Cellulophaga baltica]MDO6769313.1 ABC transporter permease [Cellulophaga sp. 1_MG-2023]